MSAVKAAGLNLHYGDKHVLKDLSVEVGAGEFFIIIGPNGSGKTTLIRILAGLEKAESGEVEIFGRSLSSYERKSFSRIVAVVPQHVPVDFPFTVAETVLMGRTPHLGLMGIEAKKDHEIAEQAMAFTDVLHLAGRSLDKLSGGERQRVIIARAICQEPEIILLDEPTAALDPAHQINIMNLMERFRQGKKTTVIMISHDLNLASMYGDRLLLLKEGEIVKTGEPQAVLTKDILETSYGCSMLIDDNPLGGMPRILPVPEKFGEKFSA